MTTMTLPATATFDCHGHDSELTQYDKQQVDVLGPVPADTYDFDEIGPMFRVRFPDGSEASAFGDELADADGNLLATPAEDNA